MEKKSKKSIVIGITCLIIVMLLLVGLTYAYYRTRIIGNNSNEPSISVQSKKLEVTYRDGNATLSAEGLIEPGFTATKEFKVENTGDGVGKYSIKIDNVSSDFIREDDWNYELYEVESDGTENLISNGILPVYDAYLKGSVSVDASVIQSYKLIIKYKKLDTVDQSEDMGAKLSFRVTIDDETGTDTVEMTASNLLATAVDGVITLDNHVILTDSLTIPADIKMIDLNNHILTVKGIPSMINLANPIIINNTTEIKDGVITRYVKTGTTDKTLEKGTLLRVDGASADLTLTNVVVDGKNIIVTDHEGSRMHAVYVTNGASVTIDSSAFKNNVTENYITGLEGSTIFADNAKKLSIKNSKIFNNKSQNVSALVFVKNAESVEFINSKFYNNLATQAPSFAIESVNNFVFDKDTIIENNKGASAGGLHLKNVEYALIDGTIEGNEATLSDGNGGGLYTFLESTTSQVIIGPNAKIINNIAGGSGGGIYVNSGYNTVGTVIMNGGIVSGNVAKGTPAVGTLKDGGGAGVYVARGVMEITGGTIENNISSSGVGSAIVVSNAGKNNNGGKLTITGGTILGSIEVAQNYGSLTISGGTYNVDVTKYLSSGVSISQTDGKYIVG